MSELRARLEKINLEAAKSQPGTRSGAERERQGQAHGADALRLKARAEILARKIDTTSRQMANLADATGRHLEAKSPKCVSPGVRSWKSSSPKAARATELGHVRECSHLYCSHLYWHPAQEAPCSRRACNLPCYFRLVCVCARVSAAAQPSLTACLCWTYGARNAVPGVVIE